MAEGSNGRKQKDQPKLNRELPIPHNEDAERSVLGAMLLENDTIPEVTEHVDEEDFYVAAHQLIFRAIAYIYDEHQVVDLTMLTDILKKENQLDSVGGILYLANLEQNVLSTGAAPDLAKIVHEKATLRRLMLAAEAILSDCSQEVRDVDKQIDVAEKMIFEIGQETREQGYVHVSEIMGHAIEEIGKLNEHQGDITGIATHFRDLDRLLNGLHPSDLVILAARPSIGKTAFALNLMLNVARKEKLPTAIFSLEMGKEQLNMRLLSSYARISSHKVRRGLLKDSEFMKIRERASELETYPIYIDDTPGLSLMQLRSRARRMSSREKIGLIVVDYLQLMSGGDKRGREQNRQQEVSEISRGLKALARELSVPVIALSQLSRSIESRGSKSEPARPQLSDLRESGAIEQDADVVMFVHRERVEIQKNEDGSPADKSLPIPTEIIVGKHRNGPIGTVELLFWPDFTEFTDLAKVNQ